MAGALHGVLASLKAAAGAATDAFFKYVSLLLNTTNTNGAQNNTFLDGSTNAFSITRNGNTTQGNFSPFSQTGWSNYFDGTGDYLTVPDNAAFDLGSSSFTVECWFYPNSVSANFGLLSRYAFSGVASGWLMQVPNSTTLRFVRGNDVLLDATITALVTGQWYHAAAVRNGSTLTLYLNGTQVAQATGIANFADAATTVQLGRTHTVTNDLNGYISNARVVKGTAVYTSNFTPPTSPLTAITNTSLLTCQSNRFIDSSTNNFTITRNGDVSVQAFSPFAPTAAWSASTNGGSGYFDGTGDYLTVPDSTAFDLNTTYTLECWFYQTTASDCFLFTRGGGASSWSNTNGHQFLLFIQTGVFYYQFNNGSGTAPASISTTPPAAAGWHHVAVGYNGTTTRVWLDGTSIGTSTSAYSLPTTRNLTYVGYPPSGGATAITGYISNLRVVKGTDVYGVGNTSITVPTAPLTAITNTSLLLNFTNAGIFDSASGNDLETVGNAQVSTVQAKWGTTSMAFDGTGDWLVQIDRPALRLGTAAFTIEMWVYRSASGTYGLISKGTSTTGWSVSLNASNQVVFSFAASSFNSTGTVAATTWTHIAVVREGTGASQTKIYINGTNDGTGTVATDFSGTDVMYVGADRVAGSAFNGYIDDLRITNGYARYTANFTAPTAAFPLQ